MLQMTYPSTKAVPATGILMVRGAITTAGHSIEHIQYLTDRYVLTLMGRAAILHSAELGGRFVVDQSNSHLRRIDLSAQSVQIGHLRELVGTVSVHRDPEEVSAGGYLCRRYRLCNDSTRIVVAAEALCTRIDAAGRTALHEERAFEARLHPFALPLERDEVVVSSTTRTYTNGFQHTQSYQLTSVVEGVESLGAFEAYLTFPIVEE